MYQAEMVDYGASADGNSVISTEEVKALVEPVNMADLYTRGVGPGGHVADGTGPHGLGSGPGGGRADGSGLYGDDRGRGLVYGPGGHIPDATGPHGSGSGPGGGRADGSGMG